MPMASHTSRRPGPASGHASGVSKPYLPEAMAAQPVCTTSTSFLISSRTIWKCAESWVQLRGCCSRRRRRAPRMRPEITASLKGRNEPPVHAALDIVEVLVRETGDQVVAHIGNVACHLVTVGGSCRWPTRTISLAPSRWRRARRTRCGLRPRSRALAEVVINLVWNCSVAPTKRRHDALHVHDHRVDRASSDGQFLLQEVARRRHAVAHQNFVGRAADAGQVDALAHPWTWRTPSFRGRSDAATIISESSGSWPCTSRLT